MIVATSEMSALQAARAALHGASATGTAPAVSIKSAAKPERPRTPKSGKTASAGQSVDGARNASDGAPANPPSVAAPEVPAKSAASSLKQRARAETKPARSVKRVEVLLAGRHREVVKLA